MSEKVLCPRCSSDQLSAQKKGFSGKKAVVGGILTGGLGMMAGTLGSKDLVVYCIACGYHWEPAKEYEAKMQQARESQAVADTKAMDLWRRRFLYAYKKQGKDEAQKVLQESSSMSEKYKTAEVAYRELNGNDRLIALIIFIVVATTAAILLAIT